MKRAFSAITQDALSVLGQQIRLARKARRLSESALAERVGVARSTLQRIERGDARVEIGLVFEACVIVGVPLFGDESRRLPHHAERLKAQLALMPARIRQPTGPVDDEF